jgi:hypothetical protein
LALNPPYLPPEHRKDGFNCPFCGAFAHQNWNATEFPVMGGFSGHVPGLEVSVCERCRRFSIWYNGKIIFPFTGGGPLPNSDLPKDIISDYEEARSIVSLSPRGAAAMLRLAIQKLVIFLGGKGDNLNHDIGELVKKGLNPKIQKSLDVVRVIGGEAVHPGVLDLKDDQKTVGEMFGLINVISETMISIPKHVEELYDGLPEKKIEAIRKRDTPNQTKHG